RTARPSNPGASARSRTPGGENRRVRRTAAASTRACCAMRARAPAPSQAARAGLRLHRIPSHRSPTAEGAAGGPMKFDLLYELQMPKPHDERSEYRCYHQALEQIELADRLGYDTGWEVDPHFLPEFAHSSAPEVFLSAVAQRTKRIRLGHGVVLLPHRFNHPIRIAERVATLDILSDGRVEFATGRSSQYEQAGFEVDPELSREMWQES